MKIFFMAMLISTSTYARNFSECLEESVDTSIALKVSAMAQSENGSDCSNIDTEEFMELGQQVENKKRFRDHSVRAFSRTKKFDLSVLSDLDEPNPGEGDENKTCAYTNLKNNAAIRKLYADKYPALKDCPKAVSVFKNSMKSSGATHAPLFELCKIVQRSEEEMKTALGGCKGEANVAIERQPAEIGRANMNSFGSNSRAARASEQ